MENTNVSKKTLEDCAKEETTKEETTKPVGQNPFTETMKSGMDKLFGGCKTVITLIIAAIFSIIVGCKSIPSVEQLETTAHMIGVSTGMVANMTQIDDSSRNTVIEIMNTVEYCVPQTNETFTTAWTPIATAHVQKLVEDRIIDEGQADIILTAFSVVTKGVDYLFAVRYPKLREYQELTEAGIHGFCGGFLTVFKPADVSESLSAASKCDYDKDALGYLMEKR